ncbi:MAG: helix-turn-helix transcriptional regulator [Coprobacillus sp.]
MSLEQYIKTIRKQNKLSMREFAKELGTSAATIVRIENAITVTPSKNLIMKLSHYLNKSEVEILQDIQRTSHFENKASVIYGNHLYMQGWFVQTLYTHINPDGEKFQFAFKAIKKREPQNIMIADQIDSLNKNDNDIYDALAKSIFKIMRLQDITVKCYSIIFPEQQKDIYLKISSLQLHQTPFKIHLVLIDIQHFEVIDECYLLNV